MSKDNVIASLAMALKEALIWSHVEHASGPPYRVPCAIQGDLWKWQAAKSKAEAYEIIERAVADAARVTE